MPHLLLGCARDARDLQLLRRLRITHVLNCASSEVNTGSDLYAQMGIVYEGFAAQDKAGYQIFSHFDLMEAFVEDARASKGRALVHCLQGVNRSGALCIGYFMVHEMVC